MTLGIPVPVEVNDLKDVALDWATAFCIGMTDLRLNTSDPDKPFITSGTELWNPRSDWTQLGPLIDKYGMSYQYTSRDHEDEFVSGFCPGRPQGRSLAPDIKTAMLRSLIHHLMEFTVIEIPIEILFVSDTWVCPSTKDEFWPAPEVKEYADWMIDNDF